MKKKLLTTTILVIAAIALVASTMLATIAYLTSSTAVSNTFTVGDVKIEMYESKVNPDGEKIDPDSTAKTADGNSYHLSPGHTYVKDPSVFVDSTSDDCYLFIKTRNQISHLEDGNIPPQTEDKPTMRQQLFDRGWKALYQTETGEVIYCYKGDAEELSGDKIATYVKKPATGKKQIDLFKTFTIDKEADISKSGGAKVTITAFAIQTKGIDISSEIEPGTFQYMCRLWNIVSGEFSFENVIIPDSVITAGQTNLS